MYVNAQREPLTLQRFGAGVFGQRSENGSKLVRVGFVIQFELIEVSDITTL